MGIKETWRDIWAKQVNINNVRAGPQRHALRKIGRLLWRGVVHFMRSRWPGDLVLIGLTIAATKLADRLFQ